MSYDNWRKRLEIAEKYKTVAERRAAVAALKINFSQPGEADEGYYRKPITKKDPSGNGHNIITGWIPVAYFMHEGKLVGVIGPTAGDMAHDIDNPYDEELWSWVVSNPISHETYQSVVEFGDPWPDVAKTVIPNEPLSSESWGEHAALVAEPVVRIVARDDNKPPELLPHIEHANAIDNAIGAAKDLKVTTVQEAAIAAGAANVIRDRRLAAEKVQKVKVTPLQLAYEEERNKWLPPVKRAKDAEGVLRTAVSTFEIAEKRRVIKEQQEAFDKQRQQDEANARAADRAIAAGEPEQAPVVEEVVIPQAPERITPTYGNYRPAAKQVKKFAVIESDVDVFLFFRETPEVTELLQKLATNAIRAGFEVPGATFREGTE